jgi:carboxyl-terminal processing protease
LSSFLTRLHLLTSNSLAFASHRWALRAGETKSVLLPILFVLFKRSSRCFTALRTGALFQQPARKVLLLLLILVGASSLFAQNDASQDDVTDNALQFTQIYSAVERNYMDRLDADRTILNGAVRGMLSTLDPFSAFFDRDQFELMQQQARGQALGFGSILYVTPGKVLILKTAQGSPSWRAGLGPGDEIVEINGTRINRLDFNSLVELLQRAKSQPVRLGVVRPGKVVPEDFQLKPAEVALPTVDKSFVLEPGIGYIHLTAFESKTPQEIVDALKQLDVAGNSSTGDSPSSLRGILLDLRDNHGGMVEAALGVASLFLKPGTLVLTVRGRTQPESYRTHPAPYAFDRPLVLLVNNNTASAAEVLAAALQEHDRALVAGEPTFGKGVVEHVISLSEKMGLALTAAQYFTPCGRSLQRPLPGTALAKEFVYNEHKPGEQAAKKGRDVTPVASESSPFHTDDGRPVTAGGGITPDVPISSRTSDPWLSFLNQRGIFTGFASEYLTLRGKVPKSFEPDSQVLDSFKDFLGRRGVRVPQEYWDGDQPYLKVRIKTELFNLVYGLAFGDEVETRADPQVQKAATLFPTVAQLLKAPVTSSGAR